MAVISEADFITSIADAFQFIAVYHPVDYVKNLAAAYEREESPAAKDAIAQILVNSRMSALGRRPICQDTGMAIVKLKIGMKAQIDTERSLQDLVDEGVRRAYADPENPLRASIVFDPLFARKNTKDNTPAVLSTSVVPGDKITISVMAKGGGSENKTKFTMLNPSDSLVDWVLNTIPTMGAGWCPPGLISIGVGGSADKAMALAKEALFEPISMTELLARGPETEEEKLRVELYHKINALGIGAQGLGGITAVLDVKVTSFPTHAASKPVALIPQCAADRHLTFTLDGSGPAKFTKPDISAWPQIVIDKTKDAGRRVDLDNLTREEVASWQPGDRLLLCGKMLTGRDAAHRRMVDMLARGEKLPVDFTNRVIYYVGPVDPVGDEAVGPAGPTTATRMDKFTEPMLAQTGLIAMVGKAERGPTAIEAIKKHQAAYMIAVGGAAYLVSKAIKAARVVAFEDLGMEAIYEFEVDEMPVTVAVDSRGSSVHQTGPAEWRQKIAQKALETA